MVKTVDVSQYEQELVNQFFRKIEEIVNEGKEEEVEEIIEKETMMGGAINAYISMLIGNFKEKIGKFRIYPRFIKRMEDGSIKIHSTTQISPRETAELTWSLKLDEDFMPRLVINGISSKTLPMYNTPGNERIEIPKIEQKWKQEVATKERIEMINRIYVKLKKMKGKQQAKRFFDDSEKIKQDIEEMLGFLEGEYKLAAYIAIMGTNVYGWKGRIFQSEKEYKVVFNEYKDLQELEKLAEIEKMTEEEYVELIRYIWRKRAEKMKMKVKVEVEKEKERITFIIPKKKIKVITGERVIKK